MNLRHISKQGSSTAEPAQLALQHSIDECNKQLASARAAYLFKMDQLVRKKGKGRVPVSEQTEALLLNTKVRELEKHLGSLQSQINVLSHDKNNLDLMIAHAQTSTVREKMSRLTDKVKKKMKKVRKNYTKATKSQAESQQMVQDLDGMLADQEADHLDSLEPAGNGTGPTTEQQFEALMAAYSEQVDQSDDHALLSSAPVYRVSDDADQLDLELDLDEVDASGKKLGSLVETLRQKELAVPATLPASKRGSGPPTGPSTAPLILLDRQFN